MSDDIDRLQRVERRGYLRGLEAAAKTTDDRADRIRDAAREMPEDIVRSREIAAAAELRMHANATRALKTAPQER